MSTPSERRMIDRHIEREQVIDLRSTEDLVFDVVSNMNAHGYVFKNVMPIKMVGEMLEWDKGETLDDHDPELYVPWLIKWWKVCYGDPRWAVKEPK